MMKTPKQFRGKLSREQVLKGLSQTRINSENQGYVLQYLCDGVKLTKLPCSRQQAYARIRKVLVALGLI